MTAEDSSIWLRHGSYWHVEEGGVVVAGGGVTVDVTTDPGIVMIIVDPGMVV